MTSIVQHVEGEGNLPLPNPVGVGNTLVYVGALRGAGTLALPGFTAATGSTDDGQNTAAVLYRGPTNGAESQYPLGLPTAGAMNGVFFEILGDCSPGDSDEFVGTGITVSAGPITVPSGSFAVGIRAQGSGGGYDSVANAVSYSLGSGWTEDYDHYTTGGHPTVVVGHRLDAGTFSFDSTNELPSGDPNIVQVVSFDGPVPPPTPGPIVVVEDPPGTPLATIPIKDGQFRVELNGVGSGSFKINRYAAEATAAILKPRNYCKVTIPQIDPDPIFGFFLDEGDFTLVSSDEEGGEDIAFSGHGALSYWSRAIWLQQSYVVPWRPDDAATALGEPPEGTYGAVYFPPGDGYKRYVLSGGTITSTPTFSSTGFWAYYDNRKRVRYDATHVTTAIHISVGTHAGWWVQFFGKGIQHYSGVGYYVEDGAVMLERISEDTPGAVIAAMVDEAQSADRPISPLGAMTTDFDATTDSNGDAWTTTDALAAVAVEVGDDYLSTIGKLVETGAIDVEMGPDLDFHAANALGIDRSSATFATGKVRLVKGVNIADELVRQFSDDPPVASFVETLGVDPRFYGHSTISLPDEPPREVSFRGETTDSTALAALGEAELGRRVLHADAVGFNVATPVIGQEDELAGLYLPGPATSANGNYWIGDIVRLHTGSGENDFDEEDVRVAAITIWFTEAGDLQSTVELGSMLGGRQAIGFPTSGGGSFGSGGSAGGSTVGLADTYQLLEERDQSDGYPSLDADGLIQVDEIPPIPASNVTYDNVTSGLTADDVQEALDELAASSGGSPNLDGGLSDSTYGGITAIDGGAS